MLHEYDWYYSPLLATRELLEVKIDYLDRLWACRWQWCTVWNNGHRKQYVRRTGYANGRDISLYLHREILKRHIPIPPDYRHIMVDHINGDTFDCRMENLRWATPRMNALNISRKR